MAQMRRQRGRKRCLRAAAAALLALCGPIGVQGFINGPAGLRGGLWRAGEAKCAAPQTAISLQQQSRRRRRRPQQQGAVAVTGEASTVVWDEERQQQAEEEGGQGAGGTAGAGDEAYG